MTNCKVCKVCKKQKRLYQFKGNSMSRDGYRHTCRKCEDRNIVETKNISEKIREYFANERITK